MVFVDMEFGRYVVDEVDEFRGVIRRRILPTSRRRSSEMIEVVSLKLKRKLSRR